MLKFLLDEHVSKAVTAALRRDRQRLVVRGLAEWDGGCFLGQDDGSILRAAASQGLTLVTNDLKTIPPLLKVWAEEGRDHAGVVFVDAKSITPADIGGLARALLRLWAETNVWDWTNRVGFLHR
jgi:hypothetical protein